MLLPLALAAAVVLVPAATPSFAAGAPKPPQPPHSASPVAAKAASRDISKIAAAERQAHKVTGRVLKPFATTGYTTLRDVYPVGKTVGFTITLRQRTCSRPRPREVARPRRLTAHGASANRQPCRQE